MSANITDDLRSDSVAGIPTPNLTRLRSDCAQFLRDLLSSRYVIWELTKQDFRSRYLGSYLGILWAFIHPVVTVGIFWFVFEYGLKSRPVADAPFLLWLVAGIVPWFFFSEGWGRATGAVRDNPYLVKKVVFRVSVLPIVKLLSALAVHLLFLLIAWGLCIAYGLRPSLYALQLPYYLAATCLFLLGLAWMTSALVVFVRDLGQVVSMLLQFGFWLTPICWSLAVVPERFHTILKLNPFCYIVQGYRDALIDHVWFWEHPWQSVYFWAISLAVLITGATCFKRLRPQFADVL